MCFNGVSPFFSFSGLYDLYVQMFFLEFPNDISYDLIGNFMNNGQASHFFLDIQLLRVESFELGIN